MAQLARANGSYPLGRWFKSTCRYHRICGQPFPAYGPLVKRSKTPPFHGGNRGSIPLGVTKMRSGKPSGRFSGKYHREAAMRANCDYIYEGIAQLVRVLA